VLGTVVVNVTKDQLLGVRPRPNLINQAVTAGFTTAFEISTFIALAGFVVALLVIRGRTRQKAAQALLEAA